MKEQLKNYVLRQKFEQVTAKLREKYPVEIIDRRPAAPAPAGGDAAPPGMSTPPADAPRRQPNAAPAPAPAPAPAN